MRIIQGAFKGRRITTPRGLSTRPTPEMVREALFNMLGEGVVDARVLDLFAGSGGIGFEALSRGAQTAVFVEKNPAAVAVLRKNAAAFGCKDRAWILSADAYRRIPQLEGSRFHIIFAAPPYDNLNLAAILLGVARARLLADNGVFVIQIPSEMDALSAVKGLVLFDQRRYGRNQLCFYHLEASPEGEESPPQPPPAKGGQEESPPCQGG
ncbi:16S rRNA (guanine(966)-N(2))-methyltransferase RsmD [bacterium]|nr:16S rRNA (guanine(966)-N(2))-methyltransferase RsmD [bacterium]